MDGAFRVAFPLYGFSAPVWTRQVRTATVVRAGGRDRFSPVYKFCVY